MGQSMSRAGGDGAARPSSRSGENARVITDDGNDVEPGSGEIGRVAVRGHMPVGYYKDPEKSAATFLTIDGDRYSMPGDYATVEADGTITLLGRGSVCINTGGEKVFPEEVEEVAQDAPGVARRGRRRRARRASSARPSPRWSRPSPGAALDEADAHRPREGAARRATRPRSACVAVDTIGRGRQRQGRLQARSSSYARDELGV